MVANANSLFPCLQRGRGRSRERKRESDLARPKDPEESALAILRIGSLVWHLVCFVCFVCFRSLIVVAVASPRGFSFCRDLIAIAKKGKGARFPFSGGTKFRYGYFLEFFRVFSPLKPSYPLQRRSFLEREDT